MMFSSNAHNELQIAAVPAAVLASDYKHGHSLGEKQDVMMSEKEGFEVEVSTAVKDQLSGSRREHYARFLRSLMTKQTLMNTGEVLWKFGKFTGPGAIISVAYIDPDNYQTSVSSGAEFKFKLLFMILFSNIVAVYLQVSLVDIERLVPEMA
jgi:metal iron transporter